MYYYRIKEVIHKTTGKSHFFVEYKKHWWNKKWKILPIFYVIAGHHPLYANQIQTEFIKFGEANHVKGFLEKIQKYHGYNIYPVFEYDMRISGKIDDPLHKSHMFTYKVYWTYFKGNIEDATTNQNKCKCFESINDTKKAIYELVHPEIKSQIIKYHY